MMGREWLQEIAAEETASVYSQPRREYKQRTTAKEDAETADLYDLSRERKKRGAA